MSEWEIHVTYHIRTRMDERGVTDGDVQQVLRKHFSKTPHPTKNSVCIEGRGSKGILLVWVVAPFPPQGDEIVVLKSCAWKDC